MKHTPAPWVTFATPNDTDFSHEISDVAAVYKNQNSVHNARLIAAAPELLEALQWATAELEELDEATAQSVAVHLRSTIAKATGEQA